MSATSGSETDEEVSRAVLAYLQKGISSWPRTELEAAKAVATTTDPDQLAARAAALREECLAIPVDWEDLTLTQGGDLARAEMERRHPELSAAALDALRWAFTYNWR